MPEVIVISKSLRLRGASDLGGMQATAFVAPHENALIFIGLSSMKLNLHTSTVDPTDRMVRGGAAGMDDVNPTAHILVSSTRLALVDAAVGVSRFSVTSDMDQRGLMSGDQADNRATDISVNVTGPRAEAIEATAQWISDD